MLLSLSCLRQREGRLDEAFELARAAVALAAGLEETQAAAWGQQQLGRLHAERNEHDRADGCFGRALAMLRAAGLHQQAAECEAEHRALGRSGGQLVAQAGAD